MNRWRTKLIPFIFAIIVLFAGCNFDKSVISVNSPPENLETAERTLTAAEGVYHYESSISWTRPETNWGAPIMRRTPDGEIFIYVESAEKGIYRLTDGQEAELVLNLPYRKEPWKNAENFTGYPVVCGFDVDADGNIYVLYNLTDSGYWELNVYDKNGKEILTGRRFQNQISTHINRGFVYDFRIQGGILYFHLYNRMQAYTLEGKEVPLPFDDSMSITGFTFDENGLLYIAASHYGQKNTHALIQTDPADGYKVLKRVWIPDSSYDCPVSYSQETGKFYLINEMGIVSCSFDEGRSKSELSFGSSIPLVLGNLLDNGLPILKDFQSDGDSLLLCVEQKGTPYTFRDETYYYRHQYIYRLSAAEGSAEKNERERTVLTVSAAYRQNFMEEAVNLYQALHPEIKIKWDIICQSPEEFFKNPDKAAKKLKAKIDSGKVGDIVSIAGMGLDLEETLQNGDFLDLTERLKQSRQNSLLNHSVLKNCQTDGELKGMPLLTVQTVIRYDEALEPELKLYDTYTWGDVLQIGLDHPERPLFGLSVPHGEQYVLTGIIDSNLPDLIDCETKTANLHQPWFIALLNQLKAVYQQGNLSTDIPNTEYPQRGVPTQDFLFEIFNKKGQYSDYQAYYEAKDGHTSLLPMPQGELNRNRRSYLSVMCAISGSSEQPDAAWDFLEFLFSNEAQTLSSISATPVNTSAEERKRKRYKGHFPDDLDRQFNVIENEIDYVYDERLFAVDFYRIEDFQPLYGYLHDIDTLEEALSKTERNLQLSMNQ